MDLSNVFLGTQGWSYKDWVGSFYPPDTRAEQYLSRYAQHFPAVELDSTFYGTPEPGRVKGWAEATPEGFVFTAKVPRSITHDQKLAGPIEEMQEFVEVMRFLGPKLASLLIQLPPSFKADQAAALQGFLEALPDGARYAVELRDRSWIRDETFDLLRRHQVAWTIIDLPDMPVTTAVTADFAYVRLLGDHRWITRVDRTLIDRPDDIESWAKRLEELAGKVERIYGFINNHYSGHSPADVRRLMARLGLSRPQTDEEPVVQGSLL